MKLLNSRITRGAFFLSHSPRPIDEARGCSPHSPQTFAACLSFSCCLSFATRQESAVCTDAFFSTLLSAHLRPFFRLTTFTTRSGIGRLREHHAQHERGDANDFTPPLPGHLRLPARRRLHAQEVREAVRGTAESTLCPPLRAPERLRSEKRGQLLSAVARDFTQRLSAAERLFLFGAFLEAGLQSQILKPLQMRTNERRGHQERGQVLL